MTAKPPYAIPSMTEIAAVRGSAGLTVATTFAGCGGSCLGFEMAGYRVLWANEFLDVARASYAANHPHTILDGRDIREVKPDEILEATGLEPGELDVFNGSPPCQAFSTAGARERNWGTERTYANGVKQKNEELFFDYIRLLRGLRPRAFVAENVDGLVIGAAIGLFKIIMRELEASGYRVRCKVLDAQWLGVPQARRRTIFIGVRSDLDEAPAEYPRPLRYRYGLSEALPHLSAMTARAIAQYHEIDPNHLPQRPGHRPATCIGTVPHGYGAIDRGATKPRPFRIDELRRIFGFPDDYVLQGNFAEQWARLGNAVAPPMMRAVAETLRDGFFAKIGRTQPNAGGGHGGET